VEIEVFVAPAFQESVLAPKLIVPPTLIAAPAETAPALVVSSVELAPRTSGFEKVNAPPAVTKLAFRLMFCPEAAVRVMGFVLVCARFWLTVIAPLLLSPIWIAPPVTLPSSVLESSSVLAVVSTVEPRLIATPLVFSCNVTVLLLFALTVPARFMMSETRVRFPPLVAVVIEPAVIDIPRLPVPPVPAVPVTRRAPPPEVMSGELFVTSTPSFAPPAPLPPVPVTVTVFVPPEVISPPIWTRTPWLDPPAVVPPVPVTWTGPLFDVITEPARTTSTP